MKRFPRFLQLLSLLLLVAIVCTGGSEVGVAVDKGSVTQNPLPQESPEILSFTATPSRVLKGEATILRWQVSRAEHIWLSVVDRLDSADCIKQSSGEMQVTPKGDTNYRLHVWGRNEHIVQELTVQVIEPPIGVCTISGQIFKDKREYATKVSLFAPDSKKPLFSTPVDSSGRYRFTSVPAGVYRVFPNGNYPSGRDAIGPVPRFQRVVCQPNESHPADFRIANTEG